MSVLAQQLAAGRAYARTRQCRYAFDDARRGIDAMRALAPLSYVSVSWGKQSICLAHLLYCVDPLMPMFFLASGETWAIHNYREVIDSFCVRFPIRLTIVQTDHVFDGAARTWKESRDAGQHDLQRMCRRDEWDGWYWGLGADRSVKEGRGRRLSLQHRWPGQPHHTIFRYTDEKYRCCPLSRWTLHDIAAYLAVHDLPLLDEYHQFGLSARTTARLTRNAVESGEMARLRHKRPDVFNLLCERFPELRGPS